MKDKKALGWVVLLVVLPLLGEVAGRQYLTMVTLMLFFATLASAWDIMGGRAGQVSLGNAAFLAVGAYTSTLLFLRFGISPWIGILAAGAVAGLSSFVIGATALRLKGVFFVMGSLAFVQVIQLLLTHYVDITNGDIGLFIPLTSNVAEMQFGQPILYAWLIDGILFLAIIANYVISKRRMGYYLSGIKEDEDAAQALGINTGLYKSMAFFISAFITGMAGTFYAQYFLFITPTSTATITLSIDIVLAAIIGGTGRIWGPVLGGIVYEAVTYFLQQTFPNVAGLNYALIGILLMAIVLVRPQGLLTLVERVRRGK
ncbi:MAG: branched-chain amino acid ABC transporter permease [Nitrososphaerota archaeon]|nr:branched-chain amino acid ABC transporter permease [Nitrososphaerota archaeon]